MPRPLGARRSPFAALGLAALLAVAAGCGSFDDGRPSRDEYVRSTEALCEQANERIEALGPAPLDPPEALAGWIDGVTKIQQATVEELQVAAPPRGEDDAVKRWLDAVAAALEANTSVAAALRSADGAGIVAALAEGRAAADAANEQAEALGVSACAAGPVPSPATSAPTPSSTPASTGSAP